MRTENTVFIVDDDAGARDSIAALVHARGLPARAFRSATEFLDQYDGTEAGCLVADVRMPDLGGLELQEILRQRGSNLPIILVTGHADVPMAVRAMRMGALTFLEKPCRPEEVWASIEEALELAAKQYSSAQELAEIERKLSSLTRQELEVLEGILSGKPNKAVAAELDVSLRTVELRRAAVLRKMRAESLAEVVRMAVTSGRFGKGAG